MDPFSVTTYQPHFSLQTGLNDSTFNGYQYIEFQVQPQNESHMRLALTELDWPYDDKGTIQAHNIAKIDELSFSPILKVTANEAPFRNMRAQYGVVATENGDTYEMQISLYPVVDGGRITAFQGRVAYAPQQLENINWSKIEFGWQAIMQNSTSTNGNSTTEPVPVAEYIESSFRITGLEITKSGATDYAIIGTPNDQTDHRPIANLLMGLEASYLNAVSPDLDEIVTRFSTPTTPITQTWGVPASDIAVGLPTFQPMHMDHMLEPYASSAVVIRDFLADNSYDTGKMASLVTAIEAKLGSDGLDGIGAVIGNKITFNLADISVGTMRSVNLSHYTYQNGVWETTDETTAINTILAGYENDPDAILADLQINYPDLTMADLILLLSTFYAAWTVGQTAIIDIDGLSLVEATADDSAISSQFNRPLENDLLTYLIEANRMALAGAGLVLADIQTYYQWHVTEEFLVTALIIGAASTVWNSKGVYGNIRYKDYGLRNFKWTQTSYLRSIKRIEGFALDYGVKWRAEGKTRIGNFLLYKVAGYIGNNPVKIAKLVAIVTRVKFALQVLTFAAGIAFIWVTYSNFNSPYDYEKDDALAYAIFSTIVATIYTILALTGWGFILVFILNIIDLIVFAITSILGEGIDSILTTALTKLFIDIHLYSKYFSADFAGMSINNRYVVAGGTLTLSDVFDGWLLVGRVQ